MDSAATVRLARERSGLSLRELAARADTSHSALAAYEAGRVHPSFDKVRHIVESAGFDLEVTLVPRPGRDDADRGRELEEVLALAEQFPARHAAELVFPTFPSS
ncbi:MAG TPA: helix-turn-helix transcriptional regulator [Acidimicrobiales bacterium]|jgi:transcriptional regulator with XRE-family HTH domain